MKELTDNGVKSWNISSIVIEGSRTSCFLSENFRARKNT